MAERISENVWKVQDQTIRMPVVIRDAAMAAAVFTCNPAAARMALAGTGLDPLVVVHRALAVLVCVQYRDGDLGRYNEVGLLLAVRGPDGRTGAYTLELPVTQEFTLEAGRAIWALPKWLSRCDMAFQRRHTTVYLADGDRFVLAAMLDRGLVPLPVPVRSHVTAYSVRPDGTGPSAAADGRVISGRSTMRLRRLRLRPGGTRLVLGDHRMATAARSLGMGGRALFTMTAPRLAMELGEWATVPGSSATG